MRILTAHEFINLITNGFVNYYENGAALQINDSDASTIIIKDIEVNENIVFDDILPHTKILVFDHCRFTVGMNLLIRRAVNQVTFQNDCRSNSFNFSGSVTNMEIVNCRFSNLFTLNLDSHSNCKIKNTRFNTCDIYGLYIELTIEDCPILSEFKIAGNSQFRKVHLKSLIGTKMLLNQAIISNKITIEDCQFTDINFENTTNINTLEIVKTNTPIINIVNSSIHSTIKISESHFENFNFDWTSFPRLVEFYKGSGTK